MTIKHIDITGRGTLSISSIPWPFVRACVNWPWRRSWPGLAGLIKMKHGWTTSTGTDTSHQRSGESICFQNPCRQASFKQQDRHGAGAPTKDKTETKQPTEIGKRWHGEDHGTARKRLSTQTACSRPQCRHSSQNADNTAAAIVDAERTTNHTKSQAAANGGEPHIQENPLYTMSPGQDCRPRRHLTRVAAKRTDARVPRSEHGMAAAVNHSRRSHSCADPRPLPSCSAPRRTAACRAGC
jgi:hypothetical protein